MKPTAAVGDGLPIADGIVDAAVAWYVRQASGQMDDAEAARLARWLAQHPDHDRAWRRLQRMSERLQGRAPIQAALARATLGRLPGIERRKALRMLSWAAVGGAGLWLGRTLPTGTALPADFRTATGERREIRLADGTRLQLNTDTAVDVRFDAAGRRIRLRHGEIHVATAADPAGRPLWIEARDGRLHPVGTRFAVGQFAEDTRLIVSEGAVDVFPGDEGRALRIDAGRQLVFGRRRSGLPQAQEESHLAWIDGMIGAENRRLDDLLAELARHRPGRLRWTPEAGELRITGTWPLTGEAPTDAVLASLERRLPVRIRRFTRYWVSVERS